jgi:hypothetical protein
LPATKVLSASDGGSHKLKTTAAARRAVCAAMKEAVYDIIQLPPHVQAPSKLDSAAACAAMPESLLHGLSRTIVGQALTEVTSASITKLTEPATWRRAFDNCDSDPIAAMAAIAVTMPGMYNVVRKLLDAAVSCTVTATTAGTDHAARMCTSNTSTYTFNSPLPKSTRPSSVAGGSPATHGARSVPLTGSDAEVGFDLGGDDEDDDLVDVDDDGEDDDGEDDDDEDDGQDDDGVDCMDAPANNAAADVHYDHDELVQLARAGAGYPLADGEEPTIEEKREARGVLSQMAMRSRRDDALGVGEEFGGSTVFMSERGSRKHVIARCGQSSDMQVRQEFPALSARVMNAPWCSMCIKNHAQACVEIDTEVCNAIQEQEAGTAKAQSARKAGPRVPFSVLATSSGPCGSVSDVKTHGDVTAASTSPATGVRYLSASAHQRGSGSMHILQNCQYIATGNGIVRMMATDPRLKNYRTCNACVKRGQPAMGARHDAAARCVPDSAAPIAGGGMRDTPDTATSFAWRDGGVPFMFVDSADAELAAALAASAAEHEADATRRGNEAVAADYILSVSALENLQRAQAMGNTARLTFTVHSRENCCGVTTAFRGTLEDLTAMFDTVSMNPVVCKTCKRSV